MSKGTTIRYRHSTVNVNSHKLSQLSTKRGKTKNAKADPVPYQTADNPGKQNTHTRVYYTQIHRSTFATNRKKPSKSITDTTSSC